MSKRVFISYRRDDTGAAAGRMYDRLSRLLPASHIFFDVNTIRGGEDFEKRISSEIAGSDVVLIFIGKKWLEPGNSSSGAARIWASEDYVRAEVRAALARSMLVVPILVGGAHMPKSEDLPRDVRPLTARNALFLSHENFDADAENIVTTILGISRGKRLWDAKATLWTKIAYASGGLIAALGLMIIAAVVHFWVLARPIAASIGEPLTQVLLISGLLFGIWVGLRYQNWQARR